MAACSVLVCGGAAAVSRAERRAGASSGDGSRLSSFVTWLAFVRWNFSFFGVIFACYWVRA